jgi:hypothetical protein
MKQGRPRRASLGAALSFYKKVKCKELTKKIKQLKFYWRYNDMRACKNCDFWHLTSSPMDSNLGECRRYAPGYPVEEEDRTLNAPLTPADYWCGEFRLSGKWELSK